MRFPETKVQEYVRRNSVKGWLVPFSAQAIAALSLFQRGKSIKGGLAEIGVHHGKSFFVLYLTSGKDELALGIDVFGAQHLNTDNSGKGDKAIFFKHARRFGATGIRLIEDSSMNVAPQQIIDICGRVRLFSIDGSHTEEATTNDLRLAEATIKDDGIVIVDDCFNQFWPEVSCALAKYLLGNPALLPFAITPGKVFLSKPPYRAMYANALTDTFPKRFEKASKLYGHDVTILGVQPWTITRRLARTGAGIALRKLLKERYSQMGAMFRGFLH